MHREAYTTFEIARFCGVSPGTVSRWIREGRLPYFKTVGGHKRVWRTDLRRFVRGLEGPVSGTPSTVRRVLIVEDEAYTRRSIERTVRCLDGRFEIEIASDGVEAGGLIESFKPDLIILDLMMPRSDGYAVCGFVRERVPEPRPCILVLSAVDTHEARSRALEAGADAFIGKPFDVSDLHTEVLRLLR